MVKVVIWGGFILMMLLLTVADSKVTDATCANHELEDVSRNEMGFETIRRRSPLGKIERAALNPLGYATNIHAVSHG